MGKTKASKAPTRPTSEASSSRSRKGRAPEKPNDEMETRPLHTQRGMTMNPPFDAILGAFKWEKLADPKTEVNVTIVREFYSALKQTRLADVERGCIEVRGVRVWIDQETLNQFLGTEDDGFDVNDLKRAGVDEALIRELVTDAEANELQYGLLTREARPWHNFVCHNLLPSTNKDFTTERGVLLGCIMRRQDINVGTIIQNSIVKAAKARRSACLPFPNLISELCEAAGVLRHRSDVIDTKSTKDPITEDTFLTQQERRARQNLQPAGERDDEEMAHFFHDEQPEGSASHGGSQEPPPERRPLNQELRDFMAEQRRVHDEQKATLAQIMARQDKIIRRQNRFSTKLKGLMEKLAPKGDD